MADTDFNALLKQVSTKAVDSLKSNLGKAWDSLTEEEKKDSERLLATLGKARLEEMAGKDVSDYLPTLEAGFLQWKALGTGEVANALRSVAKDVVSIGGSLFGSVLSAVIKI